LGLNYVPILIFKDESLNNLHGIKISRQGHSFSHLLLAYDIMIFSCAGSKET